MITVIAEHLTLLTAKTALKGAMTTVQGVPHTKITNAVNRALGDTYNALNEAIAGMRYGDQRLATRQAFDALNTDAPVLAALDIILGAATIIPADLDVADSVASLRERREALTANITRNVATLAHALESIRIDRPDEEGASA